MSYLGKNNHRDTGRNGWRRFFAALRMTTPASYRGTPLLRGIMRRMTGMEE